MRIALAAESEEISRQITCSLKMWNINGVTFQPHGDPFQSKEFTYEHATSFISIFMISVLLYIPLHMSYWFKQKVYLLYWFEYIW